MDENNQNEVLQDNIEEQNAGVIESVPKDADSIDVQNESDVAPEPANIDEIKPTDSLINKILQLFRLKK